MADQERDIVIAGGGPAGMMAGLLFARAGLTVTVLEKHDEFLRDFRGDTVHPSTLELFHELGWLDELLELPHRKISRFTVNFGDETIEVADLSVLRVTAPYIAMMPQWDLLDFIATKAGRYPGFELKMGVKAEGFLFDGTRVAGLRTNAGEVRARLTLLCAGRANALTAASGLTGRAFGAPMDVLWFRIGRDANDGANTGVYFSDGGMTVLINRETYWQAALLVGKGQADRVKTEGIDAIKKRLVKIAPPLASHIDDLQSVSDMKLLNVAIDRLDRWHRPGLLAIGDAAHAMSPVGGVGINLAVQDAVATANILSPVFLRKGDVDEALALVEKRRAFPARVTQSLQIQIQKRLITKVMADGASRPPLPLRLIRRFPSLGRVAARFVGLGIRPEHIGSPEA